jgi:hypothetical protein
MIKILILFISVCAFTQEHIILNNSTANSIRGKYGLYSELNPIALPDTLSIIPQKCLEDFDLSTAWSLMKGVNKGIIDLPSSGQIYKDSIYKYEGELVICRQSHTRTIYLPSQTPALFSFFRENSDTLTWIPNERVELGWKRVYEGSEYTCLQAHITQSDWTPTTTVGVLWSITISTPYWTVGVAYKVNDIVIYQPDGFTYKCLQAHTSQAGWTPVAVPALWQKQ